uniref:Uncharacterized protein n=1 Tax=Oryza brachyantha TaxID=4533 RepID=J3KY38_ORYBR
MEIGGGPAVPGDVLERGGRHHPGPGHDGRPHRRPHGAPRARRVRHRHDPRRQPLRARPAPRPLPPLRRQGADRDAVPARHAARHPRPDDGGVQLPAGLHPLLAQLRAGRLPAVVARLPGAGVLRRRHPDRLRPVPPRRARGDHVGAHEAAAVRHHEERQLPPQRAVHHGRRGPRRVRFGVGGRRGLRGGGPHGERGVRDGRRRAGAPGVRQDPHRVHRQEAAGAGPQAGGVRRAQGRQHPPHRRRRRQALRRDGVRRQRPPVAAHRRVGRPAHRRRGGGEDDAGAVGSAVGGHEVGAGQDRGSVQVMEAAAAAAAASTVHVSCTTTVQEGSMGDMIFL